MTNLADYDDNADTDLPICSVLQTTSMTLSHLGDVLDKLELFALGEELQRHIRVEVMLLCQATTQLVANPYHLSAMLTHAFAATDLYDLTEEALALLETADTLEKKED